MKALGLFVCFCILFYGCKSNQESSELVKQPEKIVVIGHFYPLLKPNYLQLLREQISAIDHLGAIVFAGDMVANSVLEQYEMLQNQFASYFDVPIYYIPANHEMSNEILFHNKGMQFSKVGNQSFYLDGKKVILFSAHQANERASIAQLDCKNTSSLAKTIKDKTIEYHTSFLILADMRCFKRKSWQQNIQPLIDEHVDYVIIGDNESTKYTYTWEEFNGVPYIYQGITHRGHGLSGENTFLIIDGENIEVHHLDIKNALDPAYKTKNKFKKLK